MSAAAPPKGAALAIIDDATTRPLRLATATAEGGLLEAIRAAEGLRAAPEIIARFAVERQATERALAALPGEDDLRTWTAEIAAGASRTATRSQVRLMLAQLIDAYPSARPHAPETYFEVAAAEVEALQAPVAAVIAAIRHVLQTSRFVPSVAELIEAVKARSHVMPNVLRHLHRAEAARLRLADALRLAQADPEWRDAA